MQHNQQLTLGLRKKGQDNDLEYYQSLYKAMPTDKYAIKDVIGDAFLEETLIPSIKDNPEAYFNFGFTYNDFKAYIMKITFCRALRMFIEKKILEKIIEFQKNNPQAAFLCGYTEESAKNQQKEQPFGTTNDPYQK